MKKLICIALSAALALCLAACGGGSEEIEIGAALSGTVSTDGSTSMEKVIGGLGEMFMEMNSGITFDANRTAEETLGTVISNVSFNKDFSAAHSFSASAVSGTAVVCGISVTDDFSAQHFTAEPVSGMPHDFNLSAGHEISAVHTDITFDDDFSGSHVLADTLDTTAVAD